VEAIGNWGDLKRNFMRAANEVFDTNIFIYAYYRPKGPFTPREQLMKE